MVDRRTRPILLSAFEPSGDALGAMAIAALAAGGDRPIAAVGGEAMEAAGAELLVSSCDAAAMGIDAAGRIAAVRGHVAVARRWMKEHEPTVVVVDSPAANFHVAAAAHRLHLPVVFLAAPQLWAWGPWRTAKLRRLSDHVLCLLPFEEEWFLRRGIAATFIGHPAINAPSRAAKVKLPKGSPRVAILPGSRAAEIDRNLPMQCAVAQRLRQEHAGLEVAVACRGGDVARIEAMADGVVIVPENLPAVLAWADIALAVSGTVTLHAAAAGVPMVGLYRSSLLTRMIAPMLLSTQDRLLPNLIVGRRAVPEFVPCGDAVGSIAEAALDILEDGEAAATQLEAFREIADRYEGHDPAAEAAAVICDVGA